MRKLAIIFLLSIWIPLVGCDGHKIDGSSDEKIKTSIEKVKNDLPVDKREAFEKAIMTVALGGDNIFDIAADKNGLERRMKDRLNGKSAEEVFAEAKKIEADANIRDEQRAQERRAEQLKRLDGQVAEIQNEVRELEAKRKTADAAKETLKGFKVQRSRFYRSTSTFGRGDPTIELTVKNSLDKAVSRAYFHGVLATPGRSVPWVDETFNYSIAGGVEPGEENTWKLSPNMFGKWGNAPTDRDDMVLTVEVIRVDGADQKPIFDADFDIREQSRLESLTVQLTKINKQIEVLRAATSVSN